MEFGTDKPGNIGPSQFYGGVSYNDYLNFIKTYRGFLSDYFSRSERKLGKFIFDSVRLMVEKPPHKNLLLGYILLLAPFVFGLDRYNKKKFGPQSKSLTIKSIGDEINPMEFSLLDWDGIWKETESIVKNTDGEDGVWLMRAIRLSGAGGLNNPGGKKLDTPYDAVNFAIKEKQNDWSPIERDMIDNRVNFMVLFAESADFDTISSEIISNYTFSRDFFLKKIKPLIEDFQYNGLLKGCVEIGGFPGLSLSESIKKLVLQIFLMILGTIPDSLIYRKNSEQIAEKVMLDARRILKIGIDTAEGHKLIKKLNKKMIKSEGRLNPGTTADLTAFQLLMACIFIPSFRNRIFKS